MSLFHHLMAYITPHLLASSPIVYPQHHTSFQPKRRKRVYTCVSSTVLETIQSNHQPTNHRVAAPPRPHLAQMSRCPRPEVVKMSEYRSSPDPEESEN